MRAAFSMLFGAGVILLTERAERRGSRDIADIFLRRNMWLMLFGVLHFYLVWMGDILYYYGITALLFLYPCRKLASEPVSPDWWCWRSAAAPIRITPSALSAHATMGWRPRRWRTPARS